MAGPRSEGDFGKARSKVPRGKGGGLFQRFRESLQSGADTISTITSDGEMTGMKIGVAAAGARKAGSAGVKPRTKVPDPHRPQDGAETDPASPGAAEGAAAGSPPLRDPIEAARGRSLSLKSVRDFRWPNKHTYLSEKLSDALAFTAERYAPDRTKPYEMTPGQLVAALTAEGAPVDTAFIGALRQWRMRNDITPPAMPSPSDEPIAPQIKADLVFLRWDMVELLAKASEIRRRVNPNDRQIGTRHLAIALFLSRSGQAGLVEAGLLRPGFPAIKKAFVSLLHEIASDFTSMKDDAEEWGRIAGELEGQELLVPLSAEARASYDADRAERPRIDSLGVREDAEALSNLILLESATPPIAIGLFGSWGSGKSTLIKELQHRIHEDLKQESNLIRAGMNDTNPDTRRVRNVVQIEFNAWAYADSANLWASLTSEIFDQLAAGGVRPEGEATAVDRRYDEVVRDVRLLNSRDANMLRTSDVQIAELEQKKAVAETALRSASMEGKAAVDNAVAKTVETLFDGAPGGGQGSAAGAAAGVRPRDGLAIVRDALRGGDDPKAQIKSYVEAGASILSLLRLSWVLTKRLPHTLKELVRRRWRALLAGATAVALVAALILLTPIWPWIVATIGPRAAAWSPYLATLATGFWAFSVAVLFPAFRFYALLRKELSQSRESAEVKEQEAREKLSEVAGRLDRVRSESKDARARMEQYGTLADGASAASPALMLEYLMSDSADVAALRQQQGLIARVRRCFEQLDAVIGRMSKEPRADGAIDRIILYIDDLDRCDAAQVSNVLQAVHLLLAFRCFIVVVAVDARWLKQSLETHHVQLKHAPPEVPAQSPEPQVDDPPTRAAEPAGDEAPGPDGEPAAAAAASEADDEAPATAADYLEKIFQIPLWVRPLVDDDAPGATRYAGYERFIDSLANPASRTQAGGPPPDGQETNTQADSPDEAAAGASAFVWGGSSRPEQGDSPRREGLRLTNNELRAMKAMGPLAAKSPRAVKRMVNLYRLLRVRYRDDRLDAFLGDGMEEVPSYRELLFALACENGLSGATRRKMRATFGSQDKHEPLPWHPSALAKIASPAECKLMDKVAAEAGPLTEAGMYTALEEVRRFSFLP